MPHHRDESPDPVCLAEDTAHRLLARAVELDSRDLTDVSLEQLRLVAAEAGIAPDAFERALHEFKTGAMQPRAVSPAARRLTKHRPLAALLAFTIAAMTTPGDVLAINLLFAVPLYGLYELAILVARRQERRGGSPMPPSPLGGHDTSAKPAKITIDESRVSRRLMLRPV